MLVRAGQPQYFDILAGDRLISVGQANSLLQIITSHRVDLSLGDCELVITRLQ
jgi:hypothetical protein